MNKDTGRTMFGLSKIQLPIYSPYNKESFYKVSYPALVADLILIAFSLFASTTLFSNNGIFFFLSSSQQATLYLFVVLVLPWQLGYAFAKNSEYYGKLIMGIFLCVLIFMVVTIMLNVLKLVFPTSGYDGDSLTTIGWLTYFFVAIGSLSPIGGAYSCFTRKDYATKDGEPLEFDVELITSPRAAYLVIIFTLVLLVAFIKLLRPDSSDWLFVLTYLGSPLLAMIAVAIFNYLLVLLDRIGIYKYLVILARTAFLLFIITVLVFWSGTTIYFMKNNLGTSYGLLSPGRIIYSVLISGLLPFRILMMFNAPIRLTNIVFGLLSLGFFTYQMIGLVS